MELDQAAHGKPWACEPHGLMNAVTQLLLRTAFENFIAEANAEAGFARIQELNGQAVSDEALHEALADCLRDGLIREPVRLPAGALHCHWRLELTARGLLQTHGALADKGSLSNII